MTKLRIINSVRMQIIAKANEYQEIPYYQDPESDKLYKSKLAEINPKVLKNSSPSISTTTFKGRQFKIYSQPCKNSLSFKAIIEIPHRRKNNKVTWRGHELYPILLNITTLTTIGKKAAKDKNPIFYRLSYIPKAKRLFLQHNPLIESVNFFDGRSVRYDKRNYDVILYNSPNSVHMAFYEIIGRNYYYRGQEILSKRLINLFKQKTI